MTKKNTITDDHLNVDYYFNFLSEEVANDWYEHIKQYIVMNTSTRKATLYGDKGTIYNITYYGKQYSRPVKEWDELPDLKLLKEYVEKAMNHLFTVCVIQYYPNGKVGILPHRDKEMVLGTKICGLSLGATRTLNLSRSNYISKDIPLSNGSLYVLNPPTNSYWLHSIVKDHSQVNDRISLTFRNY